MDSRKQFITRHDSSILYGVAILFMVFHHCFCLPERLNHDYIAVLGGFDFEARIAWIGKLCIAIYAFVSGYALAAISNINEETKLSGQLRSDLLVSLKQLWGLYSKFWLVFIVYVPIGILFFQKPSEPAVIIRSLFLGSIKYNGEWWYVQQHIRFLMMFPLLNLLFLPLKKEKGQRGKCLAMVLGGFLAAAGIVALICVFGGEENAAEITKFLRSFFLTTYPLIFITAFVIGKLRTLRSSRKNGIFLHSFMSCCLRL